MIDAFAQQIKPLPRSAWDTMWHMSRPRHQHSIATYGLLPDANTDGFTLERAIEQCGVYLTSHAGLFGVPGMSPYEGIEWETQLWQVDTRGLDLCTDWPAVTECGAVWGETGEDFYFDPPLLDAYAEYALEQIHKRYGEDLCRYELEHEPLLWMLTGTACYPAAIKPERLKLITLKQWLDGCG